MRLKGHTTDLGEISKLWHKVNFLIPSALRVVVRNTGQFVHSRHLCSDDALLISYPKSGSTWFRSVFLTYLAGDVPIEELASWIPPLHLASSVGMTKPRIVRSHDSIDTPGFKRAKKKIALVRDPRAVCVSYHHHQLRRGVESTLEGSGRLLLSTGYWSLGSWQTHTQKILDCRHEEDVLILKYEDLLENPYEYFSAAVKHVGYELNEKLLIKAINLNIASEMRKKRISSRFIAESEEDSDVGDPSVESRIIECPKDVRSMIEGRAKDQMEYLNYKALEIS